jgi:hypothetical protein
MLLNRHHEDHMNLSTRVFVSLLAFAGAAFVGRSARAADPTTADCLAASESSLALRNQHKLREARAQSLICAAASCPADVRDECARRVAEVNTAIPTIVFAAKDAAGSDLIAVKVTMDGQPIAERLEGTAFSIDPGAHTFTFEAPGQSAIQKQLVIREGEKDRREAIIFGGAAPPVPPPAASLISTSEPAQPAANSSGLGTQRILAIVAGGVGVVGLGLGIGYGARAMSKHDDASKACPNSQCPTSNGVNLWNQAVTAGNISTVGFIVGALGLAGGAALWFIPPRGSRESGAGTGTQVGIGPGTLQLRSVW